MLFSSSLLALVGSGESINQSPRKLVLYNTKRKTVICELQFPRAILSVKLNRKRLVLSFDDSIQIYDLNSMTLLQNLDVKIGRKGIISLSPCDSPCFLAFPCNSTSGDVIIYEAGNLVSMNVINAHKNRICNISFNIDGTFVATSSEKGTIIRVFSLPGGEKLFQFRRGAVPTNIQYLTFNQQSNILAATSETTIHLYKMEKRNLGLYIPSVVVDALEPIRDFVSIKLPKKAYSICAFSPDSSHLYVASMDGYMYVYTLNVEKNDLQLSNQYCLFPSNTE
ncbi:hypothetical protein O9G_003166 [Rozella allomycis CSF55]|uniref:WD40 repeat-like protein n=1 Tax=Rozella allomycis (strain CSF55) TaxID=988480 RepID=A0A075AUZ6_ROZAC|nr:hypothetical protein O9G_003166 [Rozella allomycis CSF55]|eukprot:EPZ34086.1 hypothetical protein O9G_003166 [Rozella allomycis CSF55]